MAKYYLLDDNKNLVEGYDKEGFLALLEQAIEEGSLENIDEDSAVASKLRSVLNGTTHHIEFVTQAQFNQLVADEELVANTYYFITDDTTEEDLENHLDQVDENVDDLQERTASLETLTEQLNEVYDTTHYSSLSEVLTQAYNYFSQADRTDIEKKKTFKGYYDFTPTYVTLTATVSVKTIHGRIDEYFFIEEKEFPAKTGRATYSGGTWTIYYDNENNLNFVTETKLVSDLTLDYLRKCISIDYDTSDYRWECRYCIVSSNSQVRLIYGTGGASEVPQNASVVCTRLAED